MDKIFYFAKVFDSIQILFGIILVFGISAFVIFSILYFSDREWMNDGEIAKYEKGIRESVIVTLVSSFICIFVPDKETYLFMAGGKAVEEIANNESVQETAGKTLNLLNEYIEYKTEEVREKHNKEKEGK